ncbi:MAG: lysylphosphatidylglycerol synthase transmembrane domain-containing protein [Chloroflexota bacterium]
MNVKRLRRNLMLGLLLGMAVLFGLAIYGDSPLVLGAFARFDWRLLPLVLLLTLANYCLRWVKWEFYLRLLGIGPARPRDSLLVFFSGLGMTMTPGKAGEWLKSLLLRQLYGTPVSHSAPIVVAERLSDGLAMLLLASAGAVAFRLGLELLALILALGLLALVIAQSRRLTLGLLGGMGQLPLIDRYRGRLLVFYESTHRLLQWRNLGVAVGLGFVSWFGECLAFFLVLWGLGVEPSWLLLLQATSILALATLVGSLSMLPGGLGAAEGSIAVLLVATAGLGSDLAAAATLLIRLCTLWFGVGVGLVALGALLRRMDLEG